MVVTLDFVAPIKDSFRRTPFEYRKDLQDSSFEADSISYLGTIRHQIEMCIQTANPYQIAAAVVSYRMVAWGLEKVAEMAFPAVAVEKRRFVAGADYSSERIIDLVARYSKCYSRFLKPEDTWRGCVMTWP